MKKKVSVIVPVYNSEKYIKKCIDSILRQTYTEIELILIDDGSIDCSKELCQYYAESDKRVVFLCQQNQGASVARNTGLNRATGDYILFVDSDDWLEKNLLETVLEKSQQYGADAVVFGWKCEGENNLIYQISEKDILLPGKELIKKIIDDNYVYGGGYTWNKFWNRKVLEKHGICFDEDLYAYEDKVFAINNYIHMDKIVIIPDIGYHYLIREGSLSHLANSDLYWETRENILSAHKKLVEICGGDSYLQQLAYIKYCAVALELMSSAVTRKNKEYIEKSYSALNKNFAIIQKYKRWTVFCKMKYTLIFMGVKLYFCINQSEAKRWR